MASRRWSGIARIVGSLLSVLGALVPTNGWTLDGFEARVTDPSAVAPFRYQVELDGGDLVYAAEILGTGQVRTFRYDLAARGTWPLCTATTDQWFPDVSGGRAVFLEISPIEPWLDQAVLCDLATSSRIVLGIDQDLYEVAIGGRWVALTECNGTCHLILVDTATPPPFSTTLLTTWPGEPNPRIDGDRVVFGNETGDFDLQLVVYDAVGATRQVLPEYSSDADISGDLVVYTRFNESGLLEVAVFDLSTNTVTRRIGGTDGDATHPRIDGTRVVWEDTRGGTSRIWTMDLADGLEEAVSPPGHEAHAPVVSGDRIAYWDRRDGASALYVFTIVRPGDLLQAFDEAVAAGSLVGAGPARSAAPRLIALRNMLATAGELVTAGDVGGACAQLADASARVDGDPTPPDFATGPATGTLAQLVTELETTIACD